MKSQINVELLCLVGTYLYTVLANMAPLAPSSALTLWGRPLYIFIFWGAFTLWPLTWRLKYTTCKCCKLQQLRVHINSYSKQNSYHHHWALLDIVTRLSTFTADMVRTRTANVLLRSTVKTNGRHLKTIAYVASLKFSVTIWMHWLFNLIITGGRQVSSLKDRNEKGQHLKSLNLYALRQSLLKHASVNCSIDEDAEGSVCKRIGTN